MFVSITAHAIKDRSNDCTKLFTIRDAPLLLGLASTDVARHLVNEMTRHLFEY